jgi:UDP:flavonoid glycosyltransferase YjiC (YdhE family)
MRILFTSCPAYGHVNPMLPLAHEARLAGHDVAFATGAELAHEIERRNFETWLVGPSRARQTRPPVRPTRTWPSFRLSSGCGCR